jgi:hypothetical protein
MLAMMPTLFVASIVGVHYTLMGRVSKHAVRWLSGWHIPDLNM